MNRNDEMRGKNERGGENASTIDEDDEHGYRVGWMPACLGLSGCIPPCGWARCGESIPIFFVVFAICVTEPTISISVFFVRFVVPLVSYLGCEGGRGQGFFRYCWKHSNYRICLELSE